jgi:hypothetical protein
LFAGLSGASLEYRPMRPRSAERATLVAAVVLGAAVALLADRPVMPPFLPVGDHAEYDATASPRLALVEPVIHAPWFGAAPPQPAALAAIVVILAFWAAARRAGAGVAATAVALLGLLCRTDLRTPLALAAEPAIGAALLWAAALAVTFGPGDGGRSALWGGALVAAAVAVWPPLTVSVPLLIAAAAVGGVGAIALVTAAASGGVAGLALWTARAAALAGEPVSLADVWLTVLSSDPRGTDPFVWPAMTAALLPMALAFSGAAVVLARQAVARQVIVGLAVGPALLAFALLPGWRPELVRAGYWALWPLVAVGLTWVAALAPPRRELLAVAGVGGVLVAGGWLASVRYLEEDEPRAFAAALDDALASATGRRPVTLVTEDTRVDTALVAWGSSAGWQRVRRVPALIDAALDGDRLLLAGPTAMSALELWGFQFAPYAGVVRPVPFALSSVTGRLHCLSIAAPWRELPGVEYTARLGLHVPRGTGTLEVVVVGPSPLNAALTRPDGRPIGRQSPLTMALTELPPVLWPGDGRLPDPELIGIRFEVPARDDTGQSATMALGQRAPLVAVRFTEPADRVGVATACAAPFDREASAIEGGVPLDDDGYFPGGWHAAERAGDALFRWTSRRAVTLLPSSAAGPVTLVLSGRPAAHPASEPVRLTVTLNDWWAEVRDLDPADREYRWDVPAGVWVAGTNELVLETSATARPADAGSPDARELGLAVTSLRIMRP